MFAKRLAYGAATAVLALAAASAVYAQETTGGVRGQVTDETGAPVANATVRIVHEPTGSAVTTVTGADGTYTARNLRVGGPYTVSVTASGFEDERTQIARVGLGDPVNADILMFSVGSATEVIVTASRQGGLRTGPRTRVGEGDIEALPSIGRDLKDYIRVSPNAHIDPTNNDALLLGGQSNRTNALLIDGIRQGDDFGLQANGYPTQRSPISLSAVEALSIEVAPFDVQYGQFQGGVVNVVTRSGGNQFRGEVFYEKTSNDTRGEYFTVTDQQTGVTSRREVTGVFEEKTWGATLSGPILRDRLFFLLNYEKFEGTEPVLTGPTGSGAANQVPGVTQADVDNVRNILKTVYNYDPLDWKADELGTMDEKYLAKLDWNITDDHRAVFSYQETKGGRLSSTGTTTGGANPSLGLLSKWYSLDTELKVYKAQLFSNWTPDFSTEISIGRKEVVNISTPLAGDTFAEFDIRLASGSRIILGPDISRQANSLTNDLTQYRFKADYQLGSHRITGGFEREELEIFNLFVQRANGAYVFNSVADLQNRTAASVQYSNAASNNKNDGAAQFGYNTNTLYLQDEWRITPELTLRGGLRYDWWTSDDRPKLNPAFRTRYGFDNNINLDGMSLLQPRLGFNWSPDRTLSIYGGVGLFAGGTPNVWISNNYSNSGNLLGFVSCNTGNQAVNCPGALTNVDGFNPGAGLKNANTASANAGTGNTNAIDPNFEPASIWKYSIGLAKELNFTDLAQNNVLGWTGFLGDFWNFRTEYLYSEVNKGVGWVDLWQEQHRLATPAPDGRPVYGARANRTDVVLKNFDGGETKQWTVALGKDWRDGLFEGLGFDLSYTWTDATDVHPGTSSVATSNLGQVALADPANPGVATSNYEIRHSTKLALTYQRRFFGDNRTSIGLFATRRSGLPYSYTFDYTGSSAAANDTQLFGENGIYAQRDRALLYVPKADASGNITATSDPLVRYANPALATAMNDFVKRTGLMQFNGQIAPRNAFRSKDINLVDVRFAQELPAFIPTGAKVEVYFDIINFGNLLNDEWGVVQQVGFPYFSQNVVARNCQIASCTTGAGNHYQIDAVNTRSANSFSAQSVWQLKWGVRYKF